MVRRSLLLGDPSTAIGTVSGVSERPVIASDGRVQVAVERHVDLVWRVLRRAGLPGSVAEDAAREVFWVFARSLGRVSEKAERAFLAKAALRLASDQKRLRWHRPARSSVDLESEPNREPEALELVRARELLDEALGRLGDVDRGVFVLAELEQMPRSEIAGALDVSEGTLVSRLGRAREALEAALHDRELLPALVQASRSDPAPGDLGERVIERVEHWTRLDQYLPRQRRWPVFAMVGVALLAAAGTALALSLRRLPEPVPIALEPAVAPATPEQEQPAAPKQVLNVDACDARGRALGLDPLIDDFEDGDDALAPFEQRLGFWRWVRDIDAPGTAPALLPVPRPEATRQNRLALHVKGGKLHDWGAVIEATFRPACYDASEYAGIAFQARGPGRIYFAPRETSIIPIAEGGSCKADCHNPHVLKIELEPSFKRYEVRWEAVRQRGTDKPSLDPGKLNSVAFLIRPEDTPYEVWLDDVRFLRR